MLECVMNISEGRRREIVKLLGQAAGTELLDLHSDPDHNRAVLTVVGESAARAVARCAIETLNLTNHVGVHPRIGVLDVVPFVPLGHDTLDDAIAARDRFASWAGTELGVPCFCYGPSLSLPDLRRGAWRTLSPDTGPDEAHPTAGAIAVGARGPLVAYNLWLANADIELAREIARQLRSSAVRALGLRVGDSVQVSLNLVDPEAVGPCEAYDAVAGHAEISRAELVGLIPEAVLLGVPRQRWEELGLSAEVAIESRLAARGLDRP